ncbi:MAG: alpha/beta hydrolase [Firmicutes bacterium]|nr:alpha/beta hydrolase [Bacillota bacterium]
MTSEVIVDGLNIRYLEEGSGPVVLLLHGWGCNSSHWSAVIDGLKDEFRVIAPDLPGFGQSDEPLPTWGSEEYSRCMISFMHALSIGSPIVIGHSNGGRIGILLAAKGYVKKLILADSAGIKPHRSLSYYVKVYSYKTAKKVLDLPGFRHRKDDILDRCRKRTGSADYNAASPVMRQILSSVVNEDLKPYLAKIKVPTLLVWGSEDTATPLEDGKTMESVLKHNGVDTALIVFKGRGHFAYAEEPQRFVAICKSFI